MDKLFINFSVAVIFSAVHKIRQIIKYTKNTHRCYIIICAKTLLHIVDTNLVSKFAYQYSCRVKRKFALCSVVFIILPNKLKR
jgi:hypothetical protein